ncbi:MULTISPECIES: hypothetical protein [Olivibacter]|uniref:Secreted protein n=1 Tax=Olivibacter jilunii TaxID=985016 RepID=A0ABW6BAF2_9SPHI|nr:hypothetical protein [Pseudosphingobacterium sp.]
MMNHKNFKKKLIGGLLIISSTVMIYACGCDSQSPDDVQEQFDADTIDAPKAQDSTLSEKMYPMQTDSVAEKDASKP